MFSYRQTVMAAGLALLASCLVNCTLDDVSPAKREPGKLYDPTGFFTHAELDEIARLSPETMPAIGDSTNRVAGDPQAIRLGQFLFFDKRLSSTHELSCASCHDPAIGFSQHRPLSEGISVAKRHTPSLLNVGHHRWYGWGRSSDTLWAQAIRPLEDPGELAGSRLELAHLLYKDRELREAYESLFDEMPDLADTSRFPDAGAPVPGNPESPAHQAWLSMTPDDRDAVNRVLTNATKAIAAYQMQLNSWNSPFDWYVEGLRSGDAALLAALDQSEKRGLKLFIGRARCVMCHSGPLFSNLEFHNLGVPIGTAHDSQDTGRHRGIEILKADPFNAAGAYSDNPDAPIAHEVRFTRQDEADLGAFKTPSLRNVALTPPYMHNGQIETLEDVIVFYNSNGKRTRLPGHRDETLRVFEMDGQELRELVAFMTALTGEPLDEHLLSQPDSPVLSAQ